MAFGVGEKCQVMHQSSHNPKLMNNTSFFFLRFSFKVGDCYCGESDRIDIQEVATFYWRWSLEQTSARRNCRKGMKWW
jgi:hypothetical protein